MIPRSFVVAAFLFKPGLVCVPHPVAVETDGGSSGTGSSTTEPSTTTDPTLASTTDPTQTTSVESECGNEVVEPGEECDDGNLEPADACLLTCKDARCGDDVVWAGMEECDDGDPDDTNACTAECKNAVCGDGIVWAGMEECDDGNLIDTDRCTSQCKLPICGDGIKADGEICDNGVSNISKEMAAPQDCTTECKIACGDTIKSTQEDCDDGGQISGDGCSPMCAHEYIMFVTKELHPANLGGIAGADQICQTAASAGNLTGAYAAWISAGADSASGDLPVGEVILRTDGAVVVNAAEDLIKGPMTMLLNPIDRDEVGGQVTGYAWTGTSAFGGGTGKDCAGWAATNGEVTDIGSVGSTGPAWTNTTMVDPIGQLFCSATNHLYCFRKAEL